ncbi:hypothetical protein HK100_005386, partial [Physocladia obscura]
IKTRKVDSAEIIAHQSDKTHAREQHQQPNPPPSQPQTKDFLPPRKAAKIKQKILTNERKEVVHFQKSATLSTTGFGSSQSISPIVEDGNSTVDGFIPDTTLDIPPLAETMRLAPGVTLKEGNVIKQSPILINKFRDNYVERIIKNSASRKERVEKSCPNAPLDPILSSVLSNAKPVLRTVPFPALAVRSEGVNDSVI